MDELLRLLPPIRRMRGNRLYAMDGRRFLDLWLDDGRGILGDRDRYTRTYAANAADKGLTRPYPGLYDTRFRKAVISAWPGFDVIKVYQSEDRALHAAVSVLGIPPASGISSAPDILKVLVDSSLIKTSTAGPDSIGAGNSGHHPGLLLARPFVEVPQNFDLAMPRLPCPRPYAPWCLMARSGTAAAKLLERDTGDIIPAQSLLAASRGLASLEGAVRDGYGEELWDRFERRLGAWFTRYGPYLVPRPRFVPEADTPAYEAFFRAALAGGALLSPRMDAPSVIPPEFDDGELVKLARALDKLQGC